MSNDLNHSNDFRGVWIDVLTPIDKEFNIHEPLLKNHLRNLSAKGFEKFVLFGHGGEGAYFSSEEKLSTLQKVIAEGFAPSNLCLGVCTSAVPDAVNLISKAYERGVRHFLVAPPVLFHPLASSGITAFFTQVINKIHQPDWHLFIHQLGNISEAPENSIVDLLQSHPNTLAGIVDQSVHINNTMDLIRSFGSHLKVIPTHETNFKLLKPNTVISIMANLIPDDLSHLLHGDMPAQVTKIVGMKVKQPDEKFAELEKYIANYPPIPAMKLMLSQFYRQSDWENVRPPQVHLDNDGKEAIMKAFKAFNSSPNR